MAPYVCLYGYVCMNMALYQLCMYVYVCMYGCVDVWFVIAIYC